MDVLSLCEDDIMEHAVEADATSFRRFFFHDDLSKIFFAGIAYFTAREIAFLFPDSKEII
jgi:hypothetical protein